MEHEHDARHGTAAPTADASPARRWVTSRVVLLAGGGVLGAAVLVLLLTPLWEMRNDLQAQRELTEALLERIDHQEELLVEQVAITRDLLEATDEGLDIAQEGVDVGYEGLDLAGEGVEVGREGLDLGRQLLAITRELLEEAREINEQMPQSPGMIEDALVDD